MTSRPVLAAIIPAAGLSSRMGRYKPLLPLGASTMIGTVIALFKDQGIRDVIVVTGHNQDRLAPAVDAAGARSLFNPAYQSGMFSSIRTGVAGLPRGVDGFFLLPADIPAIRPGTIERIRRQFKMDKEALIIPEFAGQTGHPPLIPARFIQAVTAAPPDANLRQVLFSDPSGIIRLPVYDRGILMDADTPEGYDQVTTKYQALDIPDETECRAIIDQELEQDLDIRAHLYRVSETALALARALNHCGTPLDTRLIRAGALLHDIKRKEPHHAAAGGCFLHRLGFSKVADIVAAHMDLIPGPELDESQIVYFSDKLSRGDRPALDYPDRFHEKAGRHPHARKEILKRLETARHIHRKIESALGRPLREIFP